MNITALQWNPHYGCFNYKEPSTPTCCSNIVQNYLNNVPFDFANIIALETCYKNVQLDAKYKILNSYATPDCKTSAIVELCGQDTTSIIYDESKWQTDGKAYKACLDPTNPDRIALAYRFTSKGNNSLKLVVIGAHFSHDPVQSLQILSNFINTNFQNEKVILLADTNIDPNNSGSPPSYSPGYRNGVITQGLQSFSVMAPIWNITDPILSCCYQDSGKPRINMYDIIATNFTQKPIILPEYNQIFTNLAKSITGNPPTCTDGKTPPSMEMHDPIVAVFQVQPLNMIRENFETNPPPNKKCLVWMFISLFLLVLIIILLCCLYKKSQM